MNGKNFNHDFWEEIIMGFCYGAVGLLTIVVALAIGSFINYSNL